MIAAAFFVFAFAAETVPARSQGLPFQFRYIHVKELRARLKKRIPTIVLDARSSYAYGKEHIRGALSLPLSEVRLKAPVLPFSKNSFIVTYCSCPHHIAQMEAQVLEQLGYTDVRVLDEGLPGWLKLGYPLEGEVAGRPVRIFWVIGTVYGTFHRPLPNVEVRAYQAATDQLEIEKTRADGFYAMPLRFYGLKPGDQLQVGLGTDAVFFTVGPPAKPWGIRIDDDESHIVLSEREFAKTFKKRKVHL